MSLVFTSESGLRVGSGPPRGRLEVLLWFDKGFIASACWWGLSVLCIRGFPEEVQHATQRRLFLVLDLLGLGK